MGKAETIFTIVPEYRKMFWYIRHNNSVITLVLRFGDYSLKTHISSQSAVIESFLMKCMACRDKKQFVFSATPCKRQSRNKVQMCIYEIQPCLMLLYLFWSILKQTVIKMLWNLYEMQIYLFNIHKKVESTRPRLIFPQVGVQSLIIFIKTNLIFQSYKNKELFVVL
jgi:hypothetical protein